MRNTLIEILEAALKKTGLPFFIVAAAICLAGVSSWASESLTMSCSVPEIAGLNTAVVEEEKNIQAKEESPGPAAPEVQLLAAQATIRTLYSR